MKAASYGIVDFKTITNKSLSIQARAIYCYLSCYANKNHTAFPCRERILKELGISKNGYYKHYHQLEDNCIMSIERSRCKNNKYHLFFRKLAHTQKFGFAHKDIMTNPNISLAAKVVFTYITAYCPPGRTWHFKKSQITDELGISSYLFAKAIKELEVLCLIDLTASQYQISIMNIYDSSEKGGHENTTNEDTEQSNYYHYLSYQSCLNSHTEENSDGELRKGMSGDEIRELAEQEISTGTFNKHNATAGVNQQKELEAVFSKLKENGKCRMIIDAFDMDDGVNPHVRRGHINLAWLAEKYGFIPRRVTWNNRYKGIDDYLLACKGKRGASPRIAVKTVCIAGKCIQVKKCRTSAILWIQEKCVTVRLMPVTALWRGHLTEDGGLSFRTNTIWEDDKMTINELIESFHINIVDGGVLITDNNGCVFSLTKTMLEYIGTDEILGNDLYAGILFVHIEKPIPSLRRM